MNVQQLYLDLCTSWQSEPVYKEDVMMILSNLEKYGYKDSSSTKAEDDES